MGDFQENLCETHIIGESTEERMVSKHACQAFAFYHMQLVGISSAFPPFRFVRMQPHTSQLLICLSGWGRVWIDGGWLACPYGTAYATPAGHMHAYHAVEEATWDVCWIVYDESATDHPQIALDRPTLLRVEPRPLSSAIDGLYREYSGRAEQGVMQQWTQLIHIYAQRMIGQVHVDHRFQSLWDAVNADITAYWTNERLASILGVSTEQLRRLCQHHLGRSPMKQVTLLRMRRAMALLASDSYTIEDVAQRVGYENPFAFSTAFKRLTGMPPSTYRTQK